MGERESGGGALRLWGREDRCPASHRHRPPESSRERTCHRRPQNSQCFVSGPERTHSNTSTVPFHQSGVLLQRFYIFVWCCIHCEAESLSIYLFAGSCRYGQRSWDSAVTLCTCTEVYTDAHNYHARPTNSHFQPVLI